MQHMKKLDVSLNDCSFAHFTLMLLLHDLVEEDVPSCYGRVLCLTEMHVHLYSNIVLTGGCCLFPGFKDRLYVYMFEFLR